jgi:hypothetical protein
MAQKVEFISSFSTINMLFLELNTRKRSVKTLEKVWAEGEFTSNPVLNTT